MKLYVGLDIGLEKTSLCVVDSEGQMVREVKVSTEPAAIRSALEGYADCLDRVGVEASSLGIWLYRELQPAGVPIIVVEARHMRVSLSTMRNKTDRNDARGIAQMMRSLLANRKLLKRKLIDIENHIRGTLRAYGLLIGLVGRGGLRSTCPRAARTQRSDLRDDHRSHAGRAPCDPRGLRSVASCAPPGGPA
jgi:transposase